MRRLLALVFLLSLAASPAGAHSTSAYGGVFRSRDFGATWINADIGLFLNAPLSLAVDPRDPNDLLLGTESGLLRTRNGGRSWSREAPDGIAGAIFALAYTADGAAALAAGPAGVFRLDNGAWTAADAPDGAYPARAIVPGTDPARLYLLGSARLFTSGDAGRSFTRVGGLPEAPVTALAVLKAPAETLAVVAGGQILASADGGRHWSPRPLPAGAAETVAADPSRPARLWAAASDRIYRSDDAGRQWDVLPAALPMAGTLVRGISAGPEATQVTVATHRGLYHSVDGGRSWEQNDSSLPVHLEAGPLFQDPSHPGTAYAVFSLLPYAEVWRVALEGRNLLARANTPSLLAGLALVLLLIGGGGGLAWWLARGRASRPSARPLA